MVARLLGGTIHLPPDRTLEVRARVEQGATWQVEIETGSEPQVRRRLLEADSCAGLADATALIVALMIDPTAVEADTRTSEPPRTMPAPRPPVPPDSPNRFSVGLLGTASLGILPSLDAGAAVPSRTALAPPLRAPLALLWPPRYAAATATTTRATAMPRRQEQT